MHQRFQCKHASMIVLMMSCLVVYGHLVVSRLRSSPIWEVSSAALAVNASERLKTLSQPKLVHMAHGLARSLPINVRKAAHESRTSDRVCWLAAPKQRKVTCKTTCLFSFLRKFNILCKYLFGFIPNKNATLAILTLVDYLINSLENNEIPCSIFSNTSKATHFLN